MGERSKEQKIAFKSLMLE